jgi:WD40 repeat protein
MGSEKHTRSRKSKSTPSGSGKEAKSDQILSGHTKGVLSVSWCKQDSDLLLSCGKDNRTLCWNPQTGEMVGEVSGIGERMLTGSSPQARTGLSKPLGVPVIPISSPLLALTATSVFILYKPHILSNNLSKSSRRTPQQTTCLVH